MFLRRQKTWRLTNAGVTKTPNITLRVRGGGGGKNNGFTPKLKIKIAGGQANYIGHPLS